MPFRARLHPASLTRRRSLAIPRSRIPRSVAPAPIPSRTYGTLRDSAFFTSQPIPSTSRAPHVRYRSTTTSSPIDAITNFFSFGRRKGQKLPTPQTAPTFFLEAVEDGDAKKLIDAYQVMVDVIDLSPNPQRLAQTYLTADDLVGGMNLLSASSLRDSVAVLEQMYEDVGTRFGYDREMGHHGAMGIGLSRSGRVREALELLKTLNPELVDWTELLRAAVEFDPEAVEDVHDTLKSVRPLSATDYELLLLDMRERINRGVGRIADLEGLKRDMGEVEAELSTTAQGDLVRCHVLLGELDAARAISRDWQRGADSDYDYSRWTALCELARAEKHLEKLEELCMEIRSHGDEPEDTTYLALIEAEYNAQGDWTAAVDAVERKFGTDLDVGVWASVIDRHFERCRSYHQSVDETCDQAMSLYRHVQSRGLEPTPALARSLIVPLARSPQPKLVDAVQVYDDLLKTDVDLDPLDKDISTIYSMLISACSKSDHRNAPLQSVYLLEDMAKYEVTFAKPPERPIIDLMRAAPDNDVAYQIYKRYYAIMSSTMSRWMFAQALRAIMVNRSSNVARPELVLEVMKHMYASGMRPGSYILRNLFKYYAKLAGEEHAEQDVNMYRHQRRIQTIHIMVRDLHTRIKLDPMIQIDIPLLTSIMNAYNWVGDYQSALAQLDIMVERRPREDPEHASRTYPVGVSVALDVCGRNRLAEKADQIWAWAQRHGFTKRIKPWYERIECLCRLGYLDRALDTVCVEMRERRNGAPAPDIEVVRILAKFSNYVVSNGRGVVAARVAEYFPEYAEEIQEVLSLPDEHFENAVKKWGTGSKDAMVQLDVDAEGRDEGEDDNETGLGPRDPMSAIQGQLRGILDEETSRLVGRYRDVESDDTVVEVENGATDRLGSIADEVKGILHQERGKLESHRVGK